jgi:hypothetical protein
LYFFLESKVFTLRALATLFMSEDSESRLEELELSTGSFFGETGSSEELRAGSGGEL